MSQLTGMHRQRGCIFTLPLAGGSAAVAAGRVCFREQDASPSPDLSRLDPPGGPEGG